MAETITCPSREQLAAFSQGRLADALLEETGMHVTACARCETELATLEASGDGIMADLRRSIRDAPSMPAPAVARLEVRAQAILLQELAKDARLLGQNAAFPRTLAETPVLFGPYRLLEEVGQGAMGTVYKAIHTRLKKVVAVKLLPAALVRSPDAVARFEREMEALGALAHPNVVNATDAGEVDGRHYLTMEFVDGLDLSAVVRRYGPLPLAEAAELIRQAAAGLQYIHEHGQVHRDLKPSNLMLSDAGQVKILDLGLSLLHRQTNASAVGELTDSGQPMGTADYMAPEQWLDSHRVDIRADIYSLGCTLYKLLTGIAPFGAGSSVEKRAAHLKATVPALRTARPDVPAELDRFLRRMLAKAPANRVATPAEVVQALRPYCSDADLAALLREVRARCDPTAPAEQTRRSTVDDAAKQRITQTWSAPGKSAPRPRKWLPLALTAAALVLAVTLAASWAANWWAEPVETHTPGPGIAALPPPVNPVGSVPVVPPRLKPFVWHNLLERSPEVFFWSKSNAASRWDFYKESQQLHINSFSPCFLALGKAEAPAYKLQIGLLQTQWVPGVGVFFGGRQETSDGRPCLNYQYLLFHEYGTTNTKPCVLTRVLGSIKDRLNEPPLFVDMKITSGFISRPANGQEYILEIVVTRDGLTLVRWDGVEIPALTKEPHSIVLKEEDYTGAFGVACKNSQVIITKAQWMPLE